MNDTPYNPRDHFDISPQQYHTGLDILWGALRVSGPQDMDVFTLIANRIRELEAIVAKLPAKDVLECCDHILFAENRAMATDGPVPKTSKVMSACALEHCLRILWNCREAAEAAREEKP